MTDDPADIMRSLARLMGEESDYLAQGGRPAEIAALGQAKSRLIGQLEAVCAERDRTESDWLRDLGDSGWQDLLDAAAGLREAAALNEKVIRRQIELSRELLDEISAEARRLGGARQQTYRRSGALQQRDSSAPVAVNTRL